MDEGWCAKEERNRECDYREEGTIDLIYYIQVVIEMFSPE